MGSVEELKAAIGKTGRPSNFEIDKTMIRRFCEAIGDKNPKWNEFMHPGLLTAAMLMGEGAPMPQWPYPGIVDAGLELEFFKPIKPGDVLTVTNELCGVEDKSSEKGKRLLISMKSTTKNQRGEVVATATGRVMNLG
jgi:acyl dehydratase